MQLSPSAIFFRSHLLNSRAEQQIRSDRLSRNTCASPPYADDSVLRAVRQEGGQTFIVDSLLHIRLAA